MTTLKAPEIQKITMDVAGEAPGRAASRIAAVLRGKHRASFVRYLAPEIIVEVKNAKKMKIIARKMTGKVYTRYTGYPSGLRRTSLGEIYAKNPNEILRRAVWGMLPKNKLRRIFIKRLIFI